MQNIFDSPHIIVTFSTTTDAIAAETSFKSNNVPGRLIPVPSNIKAGCGMCWYALLKEKNFVLSVVKAKKLKYQNIIEKDQ